MNSESPLRFKIASEDWEFEAIHRLNYKTFVEEIPQHKHCAERRLVDKFHNENTYAICLEGNRLIGMTAMRGERPFSLDQKLANLDSFLPPGRSLCEIRLLSVEKGFRNGNVFLGLLRLVIKHGKALGYDLALISGTTRQERLYRHLGFVPFGPKVGNANALFQPMYLTLEAIEEKSTLLFEVSSPLGNQSPVSFLPGPVDIAPEVKTVFSAPPVSHRARAFHGDLQSTKNLLKQLTSSKNVEILLGSGSLSNDMVAAQLSTLEQPGLILSNGEFGDRLLDHASRFGLTFQSIQLPWGKAHNEKAVREALKKQPGTKWIWAVHCETSTGVLNDISSLKKISEQGGLKLCLDCISSIGSVPVDLSGVYLATCVSGKGLRAYPGLSMVFYDHPVIPSARIPRYLDLGFYVAQEGVPFTHSSNLLAALHAAVKRVNWTDRYEQIQTVSNWLVNKLAQMGYEIVAAGLPTSPAVVTLVLPPEISSRTAGWQLQKAGFLLNYRSEYLLKRNWMQICLMGDLSRDRLNSLLDMLDVLCPASQRQAAQSRLESVAL